jgi:hypothetical protein
MASTILAIAVIGISLPLTAAHQNAASVHDQNAALILARQLMEEIAAKPLSDKSASAHLGPESGESTRGQFDSADDYHQYSDQTQNMKDLSGAPIPFRPGLNFTRHVTVEYRNSPSGQPVATGDYALITVRAKSPSGQEVKIFRLMTKQVLSY